MGKFHKIQVGSVELISLQDTWGALDPGYMFSDVAPEAWDEYKDFLDADGKLVLNLGSWLVRSQGKTILVDTGLGGRPSEFPVNAPPSLPTVMEEAGVKPEEIDTVVFTHLHFDHTGWNTIDDGGTAKPLFPNARHVIQQKEWDYWTSSDELKKGANYENVLAPVLDAGLIDFVDGEHVVTSDLVTLPTPGHTPAHVSFVLSSGGETYYLVGDAAHQPIQLGETDWCIFADINKDDARKSRHALFDRVEKEGAMIASGHFPFPGLGRAERRNGKRIFVPVR